MASRKPPLPAGIGEGRPVHPFAVTVEEPVAVGIRVSHIFPYYLHETGSSVAASELRSEQSWRPD